MLKEVNSEPGVVDVSSFVHEQVTPPRVGVQEVEEPSRVGLLLIGVFPIGHGMDLMGVDEGSVDGAFDAERVVGEDADEGGEDEAGRAPDGGRG